MRYSDVSPYSSITSDSSTRSRLQQFSSHDIRPYLPVFLCVAAILTLSTTLVAKTVQHNWHFSAVQKVHLDEVIDIDIGTNGRVMKSNASKLITFDPTDSYDSKKNIQRYPFGIADYNGNATFYVNDEEPGCSSLNVRNEIYNATLRDVSIERRCPTFNFQESRLHKCMHSKLHQLSIQVRTLSSFLANHSISKVGILKIDAQGSDFNIVKDVFENAPTVQIDTIQVECQDYQRGIPLYFTWNDCEDIKKYVTSRYPNVKVKSIVNNCMAAEYNLIMTLSPSQMEKR